MSLTRTRSAITSIRNYRSGSKTAWCNKTITRVLTFDNNGFWWKVTDTLPSGVLLRWYRWSSAFCAGARTNQKGHRIWGLKAETELWALEDRLGLAFMEFVKMTKMSTCGMWGLQLWNLTFGSDNKMLYYKVLVENYFGDYKTHGPKNDICMTRKGCVFSQRQMTYAAMWVRRPKMTLYVNEFNTTHLIYIYNFLICNLCPQKEE